MTKPCKRNGSKSSATANRSETNKTHTIRSKTIILSLCFAIVAVTFHQELFSQFLHLKRQFSNYISEPSNNLTQGSEVEQNDQEKRSPLPKEMTEYAAQTQSELNVKKLFFEGRRIAPIELIPQKKTNGSSVKVYLMDDFLSEKECDALRGVHDKHIKQWNQESPILCFESLNTLKLHLLSAGKSGISVSRNDFTDATNCLNATFSQEVGSWLHSNWSYSTAFYPGESVFSNKVADLMEEATGLRKSNGGKFQITSYPLSVGYKKHTDCTEDSTDKRDRMGTILIYLDTVEEGGETEFTELGIWVKPRKGRALIWNNMDSTGKCDPTSVHQANKVTKGHKYILQRWYYYESFWSLGKRPRPPHLPARSEGQAMVSCDEYQSGSCRWYDEWSHEVLDEYRFNKAKLKVFSKLS